MQGMLSDQSGIGFEINKKVSGKLPNIYDQTSK